MLLQKLAYCIILFLFGNTSQFLLIGASKSWQWLLPRDIYYDATTRNALEQLRNHAHDNNKTPEEKLLKSSSTRHACTMTLMGYKGGRLTDQINQDRSLIHRHESSNFFLLGVMDGHGNKGEIVSEFTQRQLPLQLHQAIMTLQPKKDNDDDVIRAIQQTFINVDRNIPTKGIGGCTVSIVIQIFDEKENKVYIANAGDSVSVVALFDSVQNTTRILYTTREDKPHLPDERARIEGMGGTVFIPKDLEYESSRVMHTDPRTGRQTGLAMSRSIGDWDMVGVIAEPLVHVLDLEAILQELQQKTKDDDQHQECLNVDEEKNGVDDNKSCVDPSISRYHFFAVSATDGMMDYTSPEELAQQWAQAFYGTEPHQHPLLVADTLIRRAAKGWEDEFSGQYRDDIAVAAAKLRIDVDLHDDEDDDGVTDDTAAS